MQEKCSLCYPDLDTVLSVTSPTLHQLETLITSVETYGDMLNCKENPNACEPMQRLQRLKDKRVKEILQK